MHTRTLEYIKLTRSIRAKRKLQAKRDLYDLEERRTKRVRRGRN